MVKKHNIIGPIPLFENFGWSDEEEIDPEENPGTPEWQKKQGAIDNKESEWIKRYIDDPECSNDRMRDKKDSDSYHAIIYKNFGIDYFLEECIENGSAKLIESTIPNLSDMSMSLNAYDLHGCTFVNRMEKLNDGSILYKTMWVSKSEIQKIEKMAIMKDFKAQSKLHVNEKINDKGEWEDEEDPEDGLDMGKISAQTDKQFAILEPWVEDRIKNQIWIGDMMDDEDMPNSDILYYIQDITREGPVDHPKPIETLYLNPPNKHSDTAELFDIGGCKVIKYEGDVIFSKDDVPKLEKMALDYNVKTKTLKSGFINRFHTIGNMNEKH